MEKLNTLKQFETKEKFGRNVKLFLHFVRHGEKANTGELSEIGLQHSKEFGKKLEEKDAIKGYTSIHPRVKKTVETIIQATKTENKKHIRTRTELSHTILASDFSKSKFFKKVDQKIKQVYLLPKQEQKKALEKVEEEYQKEWLAYGENKPDEYTASPLEVARNISQLINFYTKMPEKLRNGSRVDLIMGTHEFIIAAMIKYLLRKKEKDRILKGDELFSRIKRVDYLDDVNLIISTDKEGRKSIKVLFRGEEYELDNEALTNLLKDS